MLNYPFYFFVCFHFFSVVILNPYLLHSSGSSILETIYMVYLFHLFQPSFSFFNINLPETPSLSLLQFKTKLKQKEDFPGDRVVKNLPTNAVDSDSNSGPGRSPWRRKWQLITPVFLPGKSHGQGSMLGYSPWDCKELDKT